VVDNFHSLANPFSIDKIVGVVKHLKPEKAPRHDGFTLIFKNALLAYIKEGFLLKCARISQGKINLLNIYSFFITLVPKKQTRQFL
jgi:hypothetical protein